MHPESTDMSFQKLNPSNNLMKIRSFLVVFIWFLFLQSGLAAIYEFGDGKQFSHFREFDWNLLKPSDVVKIYKKRNPYREKIVISVSGTPNAPIRIEGVPDENGSLPVIDGDGAVHFQKLCKGGHYNRGLIILGDCKPANNIIVENLELKNANNRNVFRYNNVSENYAKNAAGIFLWKGRKLKIKKCHIHSCGIGILTNKYPDTDYFYLGFSKIFNNGDFTRESWGHNVYIQARKTLIEFNRFGELFSDGNNIKDRSNFTIIRYNWIAGGMSPQVDLVENLRYRRQDAYVYGNFITHGKKVRNPKMILFGGDKIEDKKVLGSRSGTLHFFNNTVISNIDTSEGFLYVNRIDCRAILKNNVMLGRKKISFGSGKVVGENNFFSYNAETTYLLNSYVGGFEQFIGSGKYAYFPRNGSVLINTGSYDLPAKVKYVPGNSAKPVLRPSDGRIDIGAFEFVRK